MTTRFRLGPRRPSWLGPAILAFGCAGSGDGSHPPAPPKPRLRVAAASDLQVALPALAARFERDRGIGVQAVFGSSGQLAEQIRQGAPFDVFLAANVAYVERLAADGVIRPESVRPYAVGPLVLAVHRESGRAVEALPDLARPEVRRIALAHPGHAPYGAAAKQALQRAGLWEALEPKIVYAETVRQALQFVQSGNAEAGLIAGASARVPEIRTIAIDPALHDPIVQGLGIVSETEQADPARAFADFVLGPDGQAILAEFGFRKVESSAPPP
ncbi:MAG TPA: molybdate ABC transporter substrate-binding protein [Isosphaeraceae bacterium]|jgi:molybdate transport system substrate-binding protein